MADAGNILDPDAELMKRVAAGDDEAFRMLWERHYRLAYAVIYRHTGLESVADDLVQEAFLRVYRNAGKWQQTAKFSTWLYTIVGNLCLNYKRDQARSKLRLLSGEEGSNPLEQAAAEPEPDEEDRQQRAAIIRNALAELPENQRLALILSKYENRSYEEIATILNTTVPAVKSMTARARTSLREKLKRHFRELE